MPHPIRVTDYSTIWADEPEIDDLLQSDYANTIGGQTMPEHRFRVGDYVQVTQNMGGHNYEIGETGVITYVNGDRTVQIRRDSDGTMGNWALSSDCIPLDMARQAQAARAKKALEEAEKRFITAKKRYESLSKFDSDEEEIADGIARALKTDVDPTVIAKVLKKLDYKLKKG